jgi:hypothetical protein
MLLVGLVEVLIVCTIMVHFLVLQKMAFQLWLWIHHFKSGLAQVHQQQEQDIKGSGSTSATTSLLVQNSAGVSSLQVTDDGSVTNRGKSGIASNVAFGIVALNDNVTGYSNTAIGTNALQNNTSHSNTAIGQQALQTNTTGSLNSALGVGTSSGNFSGSTILGYGATATANNQFVVGSTGTNAGAVNSTSDVPATFLWSVRINGTNYKILMTT